LSGPGLVTREQLAKSRATDRRRGSRVGSADSPDVISMLLLLVPLYLLYEFAIIAIRITHWRAARTAKASASIGEEGPQTNVGPDSPPGGGRVGESGPI
jgi:sec-independent protein translocase protein TatC